MSRNFLNENLCSFFFLFFSSKLGLVKREVIMRIVKIFESQTTVNKRFVLLRSFPPKKLLKVRLVMIDDDGKQKVYSKLLPL